MKRCPQCGTSYTDETLVYCLQDGAMLAGVGTSHPPADSEATWQISGGRSSGVEPPPTEILVQENIPTVGLRPTTPTERQHARPTAHAHEQYSTPQKPRSSALVIILSVIVALLLVALGGLVTWALMRDGNQDETLAGSRTANQAGERTPDNSNRRTSTNESPYASPAPAPSAVDTAQAEREVQTTLDAWADSIRRRNLEEHMSFYADVLDVYYNSTNVGAARVRADRARAFSIYDSMGMQLTNVKIAIDPSGVRATATFDKTFDFRGEKNFSGSGLNRFWLVKSAGRWRITGEKDLQTYYINK